MEVSVSKPSPKNQERQGWQELTDTIHFQIIRKWPPYIQRIPEFLPFFLPKFWHLKVYKSGIWTLWVFFPKNLVKKKSHHVLMQLLVILQYLSISILKIVVYDSKNNHTSNSSTRTQNS